MSRRRRHYRGITDMSLGDLKSSITGSVKGTDVLVGAVAGLAGVAAAKWGMTQLDSFLSSKGVTVPDLVNDLSPVLGATAAGLALYAAQKGSAQASGHLVGAIAGGAAITAGGLAAKYNVPGFNGVVSVNLKGLVTPAIPLNRSAMGLVAANRAAMGLIAPSASTRRSSVGLVAANSLTRPSAPRAA